MIIRKNSFYSKKGGSTSLGLEKKRKKKKMAGATGLEPATYGFGDRRSTN